MLCCTRRNGAEILLKMASVVLIVNLVNLVTGAFIFSSQLYVSSDGPQFCQRGRLWEETMGEFRMPREIHSIVHFVLGQNLATAYLSVVYSTAHFLEVINKSIVRKEDII